MGQRILRIPLTILGRVLFENVYMAGDRPAGLRFVACSNNFECSALDVLVESSDWNDVIEPGAPLERWEPEFERRAQTARGTVIGELPELPVQL